MNILVTGATGFIASQITSDLLKQGHHVTCCVRNAGLAKRFFPQAKIISCDFYRDNSISSWVPRLKKIDVVINCVGILHHPRSKILWEIHYETPKALFDACVKSGVKKVFQLSALGVDSGSVEFAKSKRAADEYLLSLPIDAVVIRPSLVYGPGSYGGTSLFRGLAGLPYLMPIPGSGKQEFQPIHIEDLSKAVLSLMTTPNLKSQIVNAVSEKHVTLSTLLTHLRTWLGFKPAKLIRLPLTLIDLMTKCGNWSSHSPFNSTSFKMLIQHNVTSQVETKKFAQTIGFKPQNFIEGLYSQPSSVQDRWHARLYFLKPFLQFSIVFIWLFSALCSAFLYPKVDSYHLLKQIGAGPFWQPVLLYSASALDALLGFAVLLRFRVKLIGCLQILIILLYTAIITWKLPNFWLEPFAPIAKNLPFIAAILTYLALETER